MKYLFKLIIKLFLFYTFEENGYISKSYSDLRKTFCKIKFTQKYFFGQIIT